VLESSSSIDYAHWAHQGTVVSLGTPIINNLIGKFTRNVPACEPRKELSVYARCRFYPAVPGGGEGAVFDCSNCSMSPTGRTLGRTRSLLTSFTDENVAEINCIAFVALCVVGISSCLLQHSQRVAQPTHATPTGAIAGHGACDNIIDPIGIPGNWSLGHPPSPYSRRSRHAKIPP